MQNDYVRKIHSALQDRNENTIKVNRCMLSDEDIELIKELAVIYNKTVIFGSMHDLVFDKDNNVYIVE